STLAARLDVAGLGIADLRFRSDEAADLIRMHGGYGVHPREADRAVNRAEGWVTAILLSLHAEETARFSGLLRAKSRHEPVYDYLATQVFDRLPDERRQFLMESAVLPTMAAAECDAVLERADSGEQLAGLVQMGLFVEPLEPADPGAVSAAAGEGIDQEAATEEAATEEAATGEWLRYHQLWRAFLLARLAAQDAARLRQLRRRAAERAVQRGQPEVAVEHLLESGVACGDWEEAVALVLKLAEQELASGRAARLLAWIERIPPAVADAQPLLLVHSARALRRMGRNRDSLERAEQAEQTASGARQWDVVYLARAWRAEMLAFLGRGDEAVALLVDLFDQVNRQPRPGDLRIRLEKEACITLTVAGRYKEALNHGAAALSGLRSIRSKAERLHLAANVHNMHGICHARLGAAAEAEAHYRRAERLWKQLGNVTNQAGILNGLALLRQQAGQAREAEATFRRGIDLAERIGHLGIQVVLRNNLARCQRERGALTDARETIERSLSLARQIDEGLELGEALQEAGLVALRLGQVLEAIRSLEAAQDVAEECWPTGLALSQALLTLAYARTGRWLEAQQLAARARRSEAQTRSPEGRLRASVALVAASAALHPDNPDLSELRGARRWARDHDLLASFFVECAQYRETARLLLGERRLPGGVMARLQAVLDGEAAAVSGSAPEQPVLRAVPRATPDAEFQIRLLGTPTLLRDGQVVASWRTNLVKDLLFFLALRAGTTVRSEAIVDSLLPDAEYERSLTALRHAVYHLRRLFA
ncbi:MAG: tetratricopeptide repeat protein, partial [Chloroflexota bacterium]